MPSPKHRIAWTARAAALVGLLLAATAAASAEAAPAWWRITSGNSEVWIIATPYLTPKGFAWDNRLVRERLKGAEGLIVEPQAKGSLRMIGDLFGAAKGLHSDQPMESTLPPPLRQRFEAVRSSIGANPDKYAGWKPAAAGVLLTGDYMRAKSLAKGETMQSVRRMALQAGVREIVPGTYEGVPVISAAEQLNAAGQQICLSASLHAIEQNAQRLRMAQDWARGVVDPNPTDPADEACFAVMPQLKIINDRLIGQEAQAVADALKKSGRTVAVFDLGATVMPGGVLDRLRAKGLTVSAPTP